MWSIFMTFTMTTICWSWWRFFLGIFRWKTQPGNIQVKDPDLKVTVLSNEGGGRLSFSCPKVATLSSVQMPCLVLCQTFEKFDLHFSISWLGRRVKNVFFLDRSAHVLSIFICRAFQWLLSWLLNVYLLLLSIFTCRTSHFLFAGLLNDRRVDDLVSDQQHVELPPAKVVIKS